LEDRVSIKNKVLNWIWDGLLRALFSGKHNARSRIAVWIAKRQVVKFFEEAEKMETKRWYQSKTIWANALMGIASIITAIVQDGNLDPKTVGILGTVAGLLNIALRLVTDKPVDGVK
jgi:hypothetical protein